MDNKAPLLDTAAVATSTLSLFAGSVACFSICSQAYDMFGDYNLMFRVFLPQDKYYFGWSLGFNALTLLGFWIMGLRERPLFSSSEVSHYRTHGDSWYAKLGRFALKMPVLSVLAVPQYDGTAGIWALVCGTFPQYIINISHALEYQMLGHASLLSLSGSLMQLTL